MAQPSCSHCWAKYGDKYAGTNLQPGLTSCKMCGREVAVPEESEALGVWKPDPTYTDTDKKFSEHSEQHATAVIGIAKSLIGPILRGDPSLKPGEVIDRAFDVAEEFSKQSSGKLAPFRKTPPAKTYDVNSAYPTAYPGGCQSFTSSGRACILPHDHRGTHMDVTVAGTRYCELCQMAAVDCECDSGCHIRKWCKCHP